ncbi:MAG: type I-C CRISPR-associated protein Cas8c/Csd1, partial [Burkholderiales bacterium]
MILHALYDYYKRTARELPPYGFQTKEVPFLIVLMPDGKFHSLQDTRQPNEQGRMVAKPFKVPKEQERTGSKAWQKPNLLCDHYGFVLAHPASDTPKDVEKVRKQFGAFQQMVSDLAKAYPDDRDLNAIHVFYLQENYKQVALDRKWPECAKIKGCNLSFKIVGSEGLVVDNPSIQSIAAAFYDQAKEEDADEEATEVQPKTIFCQISETTDILARTHPRSPIRNSKSNAKLVSFQKHMGFDSYGKEQGANAPVGKRAAFAYTTALNHLLTSKQRIQVGDASTVFWAAADSRMESLLSRFFDEPPQDNPDQGTNAVKELFEAPLAGAPAIYDDGTRFYVLGLAPNAARIAVRFWHVGTVGNLAGHIRQHFEDLEIVRPRYVERPFL